MSVASAPLLMHLAWLGASAFLAAAFGLLHVTRRVAREHGTFAVLAGAHTLFHAVSIGSTRAASVAAMAFWQNAHVLLIGVLVPILTELFATLTTVPARERGLIWAAGGTAIAVGATGLAADPAVPAATWTGSLDAMPCAELTTGGVLALLGTLVGLVVVVVRVALAARADVALRVPAVVVTAALVLLLGDSRAHLTGDAVPWVVHHAAGLVLCAMAATLVVRAAANEQALARKSLEAGASASRLAVAQEELLRTQQLAAVGELSAVIAHEIRNPLAILRNAASGLRRSLDEGDRQTLLRILDEEVDRLDRLLDDLLVYSRPLAPEMREIDLNELVPHAVRLALEGQPTARGIEVDFDPDPSPRSISGDPALLRHALINIVDNAILAMPAGGTISIRVRPTVLRGDASGFAIDFRDEGEGMDTLVRSRAKDPFFTTRQTGTGLGLAIVERVARVHGGEVGFQSHGDSGTTVTLSLPSSARQSAALLELQTGRFSTVSQVPDRPRA